MYQYHRLSLIGGEKRGRGVRGRRGKREMVLLKFGFVLNVAQSSNNNNNKN
jgi:hypothetical protein